MPYIPRRNAPMSGVPAELMRPPSQHSPIPLQQQRSQQGQQGDQQQQQGQKKRRVGLEKISPRTWEPDIKKVLKAMFGKEAEVDENTGQLVLKPTTPAPAAPVGGNGAATPAGPFGPVQSGVADPHGHRPPPGFAGATLLGAAPRRRT